jgi:hypothetical protein
MLQQLVDYFDHLKKLPAVFEGSSGWRTRQAITVGRQVSSIAQDSLASVLTRDKLR